MVEENMVLWRMVEGREVVIEDGGHGGGVLISEITLFILASIPRENDMLRINMEAEARRWSHFPMKIEVRVEGGRCVQTQIDVIMAAFALHNYVRGNSEEETDYDLAKEDPDCIPADDEPRDVRGSDTSNANLYEG
ncbi:hypothetical protein LXL04_022770 [Taraxacum kok-saghyz]